MNARVLSIALALQLMAGSPGVIDSVSHTAAAQVPGSTTDTAAEAVDAATPPREKTVRIYDLTHANGHELHSILQAVCPEATFTFDSRGHRIIVLAFPKDHSRLESLLEQLDVGPPEGTIRVFNLLHVEADSMLQMIMQVAGGTNMRLVVDPRTNSLLAAGSPGDIAVIEALAATLDRKSDGPKDRSFRLRIVWFGADAAEGESLQEIEGIPAVVDKLSTLGVEGLRPIGQTMVSTSAGGTFQSSCSAKLGDAPADMHIQGGINLRQSVPYLSINVSAVKRPAAHDPTVNSPEMRQLVNLTTEFTAPNDRYTVIGVTPVEGKPLAFAVQVRTMD